MSIPQKKPKRKKSAPAHRATSPDNESAFRRPPSRFRGTPFWSWNNRLDREQLLRQIEVFREMGFGGFHMHARTGLDTPYLGPEFMRMVRVCVEAASERGMLAWLYDEDRWPSGFAGGLVTAREEHRMRYLLFTPHAYCGMVRPTPNYSHARVGRTERGRLLARYSVSLKDGCLADYCRLGDDEPCPGGSREWFAYLEQAEPTAWFGNGGYVDVLSPEATRAFIDITHERFRECVGGHFGTTIPAIFTDEPQHVFKESMEHPGQEEDIVLPATSDFFETYREAFGMELLDRLPELFWELPGKKASVARHHYHEHVTHRFASAFAAQLGAWCQRHGIALTGHMMAEASLMSQTRAVGDAMRSLAHFQLPGIDMLCDRVEYTTAKQAQSVAHQYGRRGVMSELYGVTGWDYTFAGHKGQGDWQAALGVTVRVPHLAWVSMAGDAKRDYPASIHYQSPWWKEYRLIEDHFARVNVWMECGRPVVRVGVIHPIESYWLCCGPIAQTRAERESRDARFMELPTWMLESMVDFDYLNEALLPTQKPAVKAGRLRVGKMAYEAVIVPSMRTIRGTTLALLEAFVEGGGTLIFAGEIPSLVDARRSARARRLASRAAVCEWDRRALLDSLEPWRDVEYRDAFGVRTGRLLYQMRQEARTRHLFVANLDRNHPLPGGVLRVRGRWQPVWRDTFTGKSRQMDCIQEDGWTAIPVDLEAHGHALISLVPGKALAKRGTSRPGYIWTDLEELSARVPVKLTEPNVLLLNQAEWRWNNGPWNPREEMLRLHNQVRSVCGLPRRVGHRAQPWTESGQDDRHGRICLRFQIRSQVEVKRAQLALEEPEAWDIRWNGKKVVTRDGGWWVDEAIRRVKLPDFPAGQHELLLERDFGSRTELEWIYLLGDFGVELAGRHASLVHPVRELSCGDWTRQGLPFYAGNVIYRFAWTEPGRDRGTRAVRFPRVSAPVWRATLDGSRSAPVGLSPFRFETGKLAAGSHRLEVEVYGNRHNAFGPLHNIDPELTWVGPDAWRSTGDHWAYEYQIKPMGLLVPPRLQQRDRRGSGSAELPAVRLTGESASVPRKLTPATRPGR